MTLVSQTEDTWDIQVDIAVEVMQEIWDAIGTYEYEITTSIPSIKSMWSVLVLKQN